MKKLFLTASIILIAVFTYSQTKLTYEIHALKAGVNNPMKLCKYVDPGSPGEKMSWDFKSLEFKKDFVGYLGKLSPNSHFPDADVRLEEFGSGFYFTCTEEKLEQIGYSSSSGNLIIKYSKPFTKMIYPFAYGDIFTGNYEGVYESSGKKSADVKGDYVVEADGYGTLHLPDGKIIEDVLRVTTVKQYDVIRSNSVRNVEITTYRWYEKSFRYPCLVFTEMKSTSNGRESVTHQAAYNSDIINTSNDAKVLADHVSIYPTQVTSVLNIKIESNINDEAIINILDINGKVVSTMIVSASESSQLVTLTDEIQSLTPANYLIEIKANNQSAIKEFIRIQ